MYVSGACIPLTIFSRLRSWVDIETLIRWMPWSSHSRLSPASDGSSQRVVECGVIRFCRSASSVICGADACQEGQRNTAERKYCASLAPKRAGAHKDQYLPRVFALPAQRFSSTAGKLSDQFLQLIQKSNRLAKAAGANNLLLNPFESDRLRETPRQWSLQSGKCEEMVLSEHRATNPAGRFGTPAEFGDACAYLCSAKAGLITGQNLLLDGGFYPGKF